MWRWFLRTVYNIKLLREWGIGCILCHCPGDYICRQCQGIFCEANYRSPPDFAVPVIGFFIYNKALRRIWQVAKHQGYSEVAYRLGRLLGKSLINREDALNLVLSAHILLPVPLAAEKLRQRGYNQVNLLCYGIADELAEQIGVELEVATVLERTRATATQIGMNKAARQQNLKDAFRLKPGAKLTGPAILVDDILTTGTTLKECLLAIAQSNTQVVGCLTFAGQ
jgi:ComF family protein